MNGEGGFAVPSYPDPVLSNVNMHPMPGDRLQPIQTDAYTEAVRTEEPVVTEEPSSGQTTVTEPPKEPVRSHKSSSRN